MDRQFKQLPAGLSSYIPTILTNTAVYIYAQHKDIKPDVVDLVSSVWFQFSSISHLVLSIKH